MFLFHISFALGLIALASGVFLYGSACKVEGACKCMGKMFGFVIIVLASICTICNIACGISMWRGAPMCMHEMGMHGPANVTVMTGDDVQNAPAMDKPSKPSKPAKH